MTGAGVAAQGLSKRYGPAAALVDVDLELAAGRSLAVLGPNGAGKSTLLRLVAGLTRPSGGSLEIDGLPAHHRAARSRVGYIGHASLLYPALTARENLIFAGRLHGVRDPARRAATLLSEQGLDTAADRMVGGFSQGMAQRLAIARGLVHEPGLLLLDEPFSGLDRAAAERLVERLEALCRGGCTLLLVTHDLARAARLADAALVLTGGRPVHRSEGRAEPEALERAYMAAVDASP